MDKKESNYEGRDEAFVDIDRMVSEGLGGGYITDEENGHIGDSQKLTKEDPPTLSKAKEDKQ